METLNQTDVERTRDALTRAVETVEKVYVSHGNTVRLTLAALVAKGHVLFEDHPGLGKTMLAKTLAQALGSRFTRVQFTPDILPGDITGSHAWDPASGTFVFREGPIITNVLLADEINRAPPKTQSALLEGMEERQITVDGSTRPLPRPFFVLATQNPIEHEGTYPLPEAQMDRFLMRLRTGYPPTDEAEEKIVRRRIDWARDDPTGDVKPVANAATVQIWQDAAERVYVHPEIVSYITRLVRTFRSQDAVQVGPSPRATLALVKVSRALSLMDGRRFVVPDDIRDSFVPVAAHRVVLTVEHAVQGTNPEDVAKRVLVNVDPPVPRRNL